MIKNRYIGIVAIVWSCLSGTMTYAAAESQISADTIKVIDNPKSVIITRCDSTTRVQVSGTKENALYEYTYEVSVDKKDGEMISDDNKWSPHIPFLDNKTDKQRPVKKLRYVYMRDIHIGILMPTNAPEGVDNSIEYGISCIAGLSLKPWRTGPEFCIGVGYGGRRLSIHNGKMFDKDGDDLVLIDRPLELTSVKSSLNTFEILIPVTLTLNIKNDFGFTAGAIANFNTYTTALAEYQIDSIKYKHRFKNLQQRIFTVDLVASVGCVSDGGFGLYVKYSPMHMFKKGYGPEFNLLSIGLSVGF